MFAEPGTQHDRASAPDEMHGESENRTHTRKRKRPGGKGGRASTSKSGATSTSNYKDNGAPRQFHGAASN